MDFARGGARRGAGTRWPRAASASEAVVLSTCNRAEIYAVAESEAAADAHRRGSSASTTSSTPARLAEHLYVRRGDDAARHLFRVAAGLDSLVVGEPQILGQVKAAYATASDLQLHRRRDSTGCSTRPSPSASGCARETGLGEGAVSVSYAAIALARKIFGDLTGLERR